ncbi:MAG: TetR family transcriptional regulator [Steroidobacteraceae bacterium]
MNRNVSSAPAVTDAAAQPAGLRAMKRQRLRTDLIQASLKLFGKHGFDVTTVDDIVAAAGVSRRTFFRYFTSKEDVVFDWMREQGEYMLQALMERPAKESPFESITHMFLALADYHDANPKRARFLSILIMETPSLSSRFHDEYAKWEDRYIQVLQRSRTSSTREAFAVRVQVAATISAFVVATRTWIKDRGKGPLRAKVEAAFAILSMPMAE